MAQNTTLRVASRTNILSIF